MKQAGEGIVGRGPLPFSGRLRAGENLLGRDQEVNKSSHRGGFIGLASSGRSGVRPAIMMARKEDTANCVTPNYNKAKFIFAS